MKNLVIDSGVAVKWFIEEDDSHIVQLIYDEYESDNLSFLAPDLIYAEFGNIVWKKLIFRNLDSEDANFAVQRFKKISFTLTPTTSLFNDAFKIAVRYKRTFYDSLYLALSVRENCGFVTADEKFYNSIDKDFPETILLANWQ